MPSKYVGMHTNATLAGVWGYGGGKGRGGSGGGGEVGEGGPPLKPKNYPQKWNGQSVGPFQSHNSVQSKFCAPNFHTVLSMLHTQIEANLKTVPSSRNLNFIREEQTKKEKRKKFMHFSLLVPLWPSLKQAKTGKQSFSKRTLEKLTQTCQDSEKSQQKSFSPNTVLQLQNHWNADSDLLRQGTWSATENKNESLRTYLLHVFVAPSFDLFETLFCTWHLLLRHLFRHCRFLLCFILTLRLDIFHSSGTVCRLLTGLWRWNVSVAGQLQEVWVQCCFMSAETVWTIRDTEPRTVTSTFTQLLSSETVNFNVALRPQRP